MKRLSIIVLVLVLLGSLYFNFDFWRKSKVQAENMLARDQRDAKFRQDFTNTKNARTELYKLLQIDSTDIVFLGNSLTETFPVTELANDANVKNHAVSGYTAKDVLENLSSIIVGHPKKIFIEVGINDIKYGLSDKPQLKKGLVGDIHQILENIHQISPYTEVYVQSILPVNKLYNTYEADEINFLVKEINPELAAITNKYNYHYIDLYSIFSDYNNLPMKYTTDGIHLNEKAYMVWFDNIKKYIY